MKPKGEVRSEHKDLEITCIPTVFRAMGLNEVDWKNCIEKRRETKIDPCSTHTLDVQAEEKWNP